MSFDHTAYISNSLTPDILLVGLGGREGGLEHVGLEWVALRSCYFPGLGMAGAFVVVGEGGGIIPQCTVCGRTAIMSLVTWKPATSCLLITEYGPPTQAILYHAAMWPPAFPNHIAHAHWIWWQRWDESGKLLLKGKGTQHI